MEKIQELLNKGDIKYKASMTQNVLASNIKMVSHLTSPIKIQDKEKEDVHNKDKRPKEEKTKSEQF